MYTRYVYEISRRVGVEKSRPCVCIYISYKYIYISYIHTRTSVYRWDVHVSHKYTLVYICRKVSYMHETCMHIYLIFVYTSHIHTLVRTSWVIHKNLNICDRWFQLIGSRKFHVIFLGPNLKSAVTYIQILICYSTFVQTNVSQLQSFCDEYMKCTYLYEYTVCNSFSANAPSTWWPLNSDTYTHTHTRTLRLPVSVSLSRTHTYMCVCVCVFVCVCVCVPVPQRHKRRTYERCI